MSSSQDTSGHERRLTRTKLLVDEALQRSQEGSGPSNWKDYLDAHAALLRAERDLAQANGEEAALEIEWKMPWDNGAPLPHVLSSGHMTLLLYHIAEPDPGWDGTYVNVVGVDTPGQIALVELVRCYAFKFGGPNDEVFGGHPLTGKGFGGYGAYVVANSKWLDQEMRIQSVHRGFDPARWKDTRHYLLAFHDEMLECLAEDHRLHALDMSMAEALEVAQKRLVADWG